MVASYRVASVSNTGLASQKAFPITDAGWSKARKYWLALTKMEHVIYCAICTRDEDDLLYNGRLRDQFVRYDRGVEK